MCLLCCSLLELLLLSVLNRKLAIFPSWDLPIWTVCRQGLFLQSRFVAVLAHVLHMFTTNKWLQIKFVLHFFCKSKVVLTSSTLRNFSFWFILFLIVSASSSLCLQALIPWSIFDPGNITSSRVNNFQTWESNMGMIYMQIEQSVSAQSTTPLLYSSKTSKPWGTSKFFLASKIFISAWETNSKDFSRLSLVPFSSGWIQCFTVWLLIREDCSCF